MFRVRESVIGLHVREYWESAQRGDDALPPQDGHTHSSLWRGGGRRSTEASSISLWHSSRYKTLI